MNNSYDTKNREYDAGLTADVVVIDDEESLCEGCRQTLENEGLKTRYALNGLEGLQLVEQARPQVVLVDLKMPGMNGIEVLAKISEIDSTITSIVISGYGTIESVVESMKIGATDFLSKPFEPEKLVDAVRRGLRLGDLHRQPEIAPDKSWGQEAVAAPIETKEDVLLKGLEMLESGYAVGLERRSLMEELQYLENETTYHTASLDRIKQREAAIHHLIQDLKLVNRVIEAHEFKKSRLIQILLDIQAELRWLPKHSLRWVAARLKVPYAEVLAITSFYDTMNLEPQGKHTIQVCTGTACHVRGAPELLARVSSVLGIGPGETDAEQRFTLKTVHCMGCCALAPVLKLDDEYYSNPSPAKLSKLINSVDQKETETWKN